MSFNTNAQDIRVDDGHILRARLQNNNGDFVDAEIDLDTCLGNNSGMSPFCRPSKLDRLLTIFYRSLRLGWTRFDTASYMMMINDLKLT